MTDDPESNVTRGANIKKEQEQLKLINKTIFLHALACHTLGWFEISGALEKVLPPPTIHDRFEVDQGIEIGKKARELFPKGKPVMDFNSPKAVRTTEELMNDSKVTSIFEATFISQGFVTRADILERVENSWHLIEVKSSINDKIDFIPDMAFTYAIASLSGVKISKISLMLVSRDFRLGMDNSKLFVLIDKTKEIMKFRESLPLEEIRKQLNSQTGPAPVAKLICSKCPMFRECVGKNIENHVLDVPRLSDIKLSQLISLNITSIENIPEEFPLTEIQSNVRKCVIKKGPVIDEDLGIKLASIVFPVYYLDFESVNLALPPYSDIAPYTMLPTQYSIHECSAVGQVTEHREFLADPSKDSRRDLAENLIRDLGQAGSVVTYSSFEKTVISGLGLLFPDLKASLDRLLARLVDLSAIVGKNIFHPDFHGKYSLKVVLPILVPTLTYRDLKIQNGGDAIAMFAWMIKKKLYGKQIDETRNNLCKYCERDTLAMVRLHEKLAELAADLNLK